MPQTKAFWSKRKGRRYKQIIACPVSQRDSRSLLIGRGGGLLVEGRVNLSGVKVVCPDQSSNQTFIRRMARLRLLTRSRKSHSTERAIELALNQALGGLDS